MTESLAQELSGRQIRRIVLEQSKRAHVGHIGSALSIADIVAVLYRTVLRIEDPNDPGRDRFILSKGHAALALYAALFLRGWITNEELNSFCGDDTLLGVHPDHGLVGVEFSTGSLGHGLSVGVGSALAARQRQTDRRTFVLMSDAECNEGSVWEAAMFASHHRVAGLTAIIDVNGQQALGYTADVLSQTDLTARWRAFGWRAVEVDGHDEHALGRALTRSPSDGSPTVLLAATTFGRGVSFMERRIEWHYLPMTDEEYAKAMQELQS